MIRSLLLVVAGVFLSYVVLVIGSWLILKSDVGRRNLESGTAAMNAAERGEAVSEKDATEFAETLEQTLWLYKFVLLPLVALFVGGFMGFLAKNKAYILAIISFLPVNVFYLFANEWNVTSLLFGVVYFLVAVSTAVGISKLSSSQGRTQNEYRRI
jgi:hypothetical protein